MHANALAPRPWLFSPALDLLVGCGAWSLPLLAGTYFLQQENGPAVAFAFYLLAVFCNNPHYMATIHRAYHTAEDFRKYRFFTVYVTVLLVLTVLLVHFVPGLFPWVLTLYLTWSPWHYTGQNFGIAQMLARRAGVQTDPAARHLLYASYVASYAVWFLTLHTTREGDPYFLSLNIPVGPAFTFQIVGILVFLGCAGAAFVRLRRQIPTGALIGPIVLTLTQALWFVAPTLLASTGLVELPASYFSAGALAFMHCAQYLWITSYYARRENGTAQSAAATQRPFSFARYYLLLVIGGIALFIPGPWLASRMLGHDFVESFLIFMALVNPENFLRHAFKLEVGSDDWNHLERGFREAFDIPVSDEPRRTQDRATENFAQAHAEMSLDHFENEADTDWSLPQNGRWAESLVAQSKADREVIPWIIDGEEAGLDLAAAKECRDPSRSGEAVARYVEATLDEVERAVQCAKADADGWRSLTVNERNQVLGRVAAELRQARGRLMWAALANGGKTLAESDPEVSEAIDFVEFYRSSARSFFELESVEAHGRGVVVVVPPWNFPIAIPCGGIAAALAAGNTVIMKPASDTVLVAWELCQCFWRAGVSRKVLQFAPCPGSGVGASLVSHPAIDAVILTGGTDTARRMLERKPDLRLFAETGGKNATIITSLSDRELALKHVVHSAFSHAGQKCSATSLLLLEREVYEDADFKRMLCDAVRSIQVGSAWELSSRMGPVIRPPGGELEQALKTLEPGESWAVMPHQIGNNPHLWSPGVKWGVTRGSFTHLTEFFGPVLAVLPFETLDEAIAMVNDTGYGLTSGIQSLDEREIAQWREGIQAGNLYINRSTVGAVVLRQPFGGMGRSCFGPGMKAGGPNYVAQFLRFEDRVPAGSEQPILHAALALLAERVVGVDSPLFAEERPRVLAALRSFDQAWQEEFSREHDHLRLLGQDNVRRYLPFASVRVRLDVLDMASDIVVRVAAAKVTGAKVVVSIPPELGSPVVYWLQQVTGAWGTAIEFVEEDDTALIARIETSPYHPIERIRYASPGSVPTGVRAAAAAKGVYLADEPVLAEGRIELLWYLREQSISHDYHRYGNLGSRVGEARREPA